MAALVLALGVAIYVSVEKVLERKREKRILRAQETSEHGLVEELPTDDHTTSLLKDEHIQVYHQERNSPYLKDGRSRSRIWCR